MKLKIKQLTPTAKIPTKAHATDLGFDLYADETVEILLNELKVIKTGIAVQFPENYGGFIKDRSSMASKGYLITGGVIDPDYIGELSIVITNHDINSYSKTIYQGDKIAQLVLIHQPKCDVEVVDELTSYSRGSNGFGSSGQ